MLVEVLLQLLIGQVDAELLKVVLLEALKAIDIKHADQGRCSCILPNCRVDLCHQPIKHAGVDGLSQRVTVVQGCLDVYGANNGTCRQ